MGNTITPQLKHAFYPHHEQTSQQFGREILCLIYNPDNFGMIIAAGNSKLIYFCKMHTYECFSIEGHEDSITCMALDKNFLLTGSDDKTIKIWVKRRLEKVLKNFPRKHRVIIICFILLMQHT